MKVKRISGIDRVLDQVLTPSSSHGPATTENAAQGTKPFPPILPVSFAGERCVLGHIEARRGRPPKRPNRPAGQKEKVTFRISRHLIADYRDWSWEARCQLSELVEQALLKYRESRDQRQ